ncbi:MAG: Tryptophan-tRNA ligase [Candidatus Uhrbacteria bacterium GW2011_GWF2_41_16]|uniref:Tryptophan--tRNA ligase n=2 Tax=Candidatus Uhriibacteriota TaxID=1752732 RepID=A0A0G0VCR3_9BACT|nr:MAG: Tryptophan-tRNA ligase [Candidatus Uhrbacteria bacterium GW2011_GWC2_41_11]KKR98653.1 MAG: Tryptophan-tRNA ligase [Candidatus Uhrbacteria bacterium GW2011_GWF2_41_16]HBP00040.1 tryptophan--tRNA ligase [Candidatus Uhrbacteria bacterium]
MKRTLTGLQPTGFLHIGNYFGAIEPMVNTQGEGERFLFIVDYHAITVPQDPEKLRKNILFAAATYLAAGIDPNQTIIFQQSRISEHTELGWILHCHASMGELSRMTQFKDKSKDKGEHVSVGLFTYPLLMVADILLYDINAVPVGEDQKQHVELTRDIAERFNRLYGETFVLPEPQIRSFGARIMGLDDPMKKMSKSASSPKNYISLLDKEDVIRKKIMSAVTDTGSSIEYELSRPGLANLMTIFSLITKKSFDQIKIDYAGSGYGDFKRDLAEVLVLFLKPIQANIHTYLEQEDELKKILDIGAEHAKEIAEQKMQIVRERIGVKL